MDRHRRKWGGGQAPPDKKQITSKIAEDYDHYLVMLQEKNRLLKRLRRKDNHQIDLEKKEQGFSLYLNGANTALHPSERATKQQQDSKTATRKRATKTADAGVCVTPDEGEYRAKTAPSKRKSWIHDSVDLRTEEGDPLHVKAPGLLTGEYEEDFETTAEEAILKQAINSDDSPHEELAVSFEDIGVLRRSLEGDEMIQTSLGRMRSESCGSLDSLGSGGSCSEELEDSDAPTQPHEAPEDGIVLEFASHPPTSHRHALATRSLSASRKKPREDIPSSKTQDVLEAVYQENEAVGHQETQDVLEAVYHENEAVGHQRTHDENDTLCESPPSRSPSPMAATTSGPRSPSPMAATTSGPRSPSPMAATTRSPSPMAATTRSHSPMAATTSGPRSHSPMAATTSGPRSPSPMAATTSGPRSPSPMAATTRSHSPMAATTSGPRSHSPMAATTSGPRNSSPMAATTRSPSPMAATRSPDTTVQMSEDHSIFGPAVHTSDHQQLPEWTIHADGDEDGAHRNGSQVPRSERPREQSLLSSAGASDSLTEVTLRVITEQVRKMDARKQRKLLHLLRRLDQQTPSSTSLLPDQESSPAPLLSDQETSSAPLPPGHESSSAHLPPGHESSPAPLPPATGHQDSPSPHPIDNGHSSLHTSTPNRQASPGAVRCSDGLSQELEVQLRILSNWGHPTLVGLTEVEFFSSLDGKRVWLASNRVRVEGEMDGGEGDTGRIVNGKMKTTNSRHMWTHPFPLTLTFTLPSHIVTGDPLRAVSKIRVWNYNKNIHELSIGAKDMQIFVNGQLLWQGTINKGCGSQVFDYCTEIPLDKGGPQIQPLWLPTPQPAPAPVSVSVDVDFFERPASNRPSSGRMSGLRGQLLSRQSSEPAPLRSSSDSYLPSFLDDDDNRPRLKTAVIMKGRRTLRPGSDTCLYVDSSSTHLERPHPLPRRATLPSVASPLTVTMPPTPSLSVYEPEVSVCHVPRTPSDIEQSLASISKFDHSHLGQIGLDYQDDILESFLEEYRQRRQCSEVPPVDSSPEGEEECFPIPELPSGRELVINILTTWGDGYYVGLTGIEVFTDSGEVATVAEISSDPEDINVLPEYHDDPRVVGNLVDGVNKTRDDLHMWLAPYTAGRDHLVWMRFHSTTTLAMIRIWNYNKSRIHSYRGARDIEMYLDGQMILKGEIARACGGLVGGTEAFGETILFTTDEDVLLRVAEHDDSFQGEVACCHGDETEEAESQRPSTADVGNENVQDDERPFTSVNLLQEVSEQPTSASQVVEVVLTASWGGSGYIGLTGLELLHADGHPLKADQLQVTLSESLEHHDCGSLTDGTNLTTDDSHMWCVPFTPGTQHTLTITLDTPTPLSALRIWNYNKSLEDSYMGTKVVHVCLDGATTTSPNNGFLVRRAPGHTHYDFGQLLPFQTQHSQKEENEVEEETELPRGFVYQLQLLSSWGDPYYIGLNGLEFYDGRGALIPLNENNIAAFPESVNVLEGVTGDVRTPDKLVDGVCDTDDGRHMWLSPLLPDVVNSVYVIFDEPQIISVVKLWNYGKTPSRGAKEFAILVDDLLLYMGVLPPVPTHARGILPTLSLPVDPFVVSFTEQEHSKQTASSNGSSCGGDILLTNNHQSITPGLTKTQRAVPPNQDLRPLTSLTLYGQRQQSRWW